VGLAFYNRGWIERALVMMKERGSLTGIQEG